jgi:hypothetical protein
MRSPSFHQHNLKQHEKAVTYAQHPSEKRLFPTFVPRTDPRTGLFLARAEQHCGLPALFRGHMPAIVACRQQALAKLARSDCRRCEISESLVAHASRRPIRRACESIAALTLGSTRERASRRIAITRTGLAAILRDGASRLLRVRGDTFSRLRRWPL